MADEQSGRPWMAIETELTHLRRSAKSTAELTKGLMKHPCFEVADNSVMDAGEMKANIMLAYRHLEDAVMRMGKVIQAHDGGVSVYDK